mmetsp:Transcript_9798/g.39770  ORF Transcript_9798/g.39770 Transcript_9798/m.39770 type:complete len:781 (-) Transcript_9798:103-2445(-)|eukprot:CAMPEP_0114619780 /NCGR_PEP_ID=MMETSP0168-20121206/8385_1 /TAXON_ID=95228 ORGANISM="Vannella sp., Strain DIVA3 517/6/12" /NCGR_SAMPLE_ID=MMETSP0168 /ASSEMBLY_ACC=CAM_ASM_000044 /LENGTH=780 /DNA_ID=CAMNT_0001830949 /DNA_START=34 /DNA_END=2376 /DNA_ORIENTATION=-
MEDSCQLIQNLQTDGSEAGNCECAAVSPTSKKLFIAAKGSNAYIWAAGKAQSLITLQGHTSPVTSVGFHANETYVGGGGEDGSLKIWDLKQGGMVARTLVGEQTPGEAIRTTIFHPLGADIVVTGSSSGIVSVWNYRTRSCLKSLDAHKTPQSVASHYQTDAPQAAMTQESLSARRIALAAARERSEMRPQASSGPVLQFSPNGRWLLYAPAFTAKELATAKELHELTCGVATSASMHELMYSFVHVWDMTSGEEIAFLEHSNVEGAVTSYAFHPHELILATSTAAGVIRIWDLEKQFSKIAEIRCERSSVDQAGGSRLLFTPDGTEMICLSRTSNESWMDRFWFSSADHTVAPIGSARVGWNQELLDVAQFQEASLIALEAGPAPNLWIVNSKCAVQQRPAPRRKRPVLVANRPEPIPAAAAAKEATPAAAPEMPAEKPADVAEPKVEKVQPKAEPATVAKEEAPEAKTQQKASPPAPAPTTKVSPPARLAKREEVTPPAKPAAAVQKVTPPVKAAAQPKVSPPVPTRTAPANKPLAAAGKSKRRVRTRSKPSKENGSGTERVSGKKQKFIRGDRTAAEEPLNFADFLPKGCTVDPLQQKSASEVAAELFAPSVHKKFCSTLFARIGALKTLRNQAKKSEWTAVLDTAARSKDTALVANLFEGVLGRGLPVIKSKHIVYQPVHNPFQPEQCRDLMQLVQQLISSKNNDHAIIGMTMLQRTTLSCSRTTLKSTLCFQYFNIVMRQLQKIRKMSSNDDSPSKRRLQSLAKLVSSTYRDSIA